MRISLRASKLESGSNGDSRRPASNIRVDIATSKRVIDIVGSDGGALSILRRGGRSASGFAAFALISITRSRLSSPRCLPRIISDSISAETPRLSPRLRSPGPLFHLFIFFTNEYVQISRSPIGEDPRYYYFSENVTRLLIRFLLMVPLKNRLYNHRSL